MAGKRSLELALKIKALVEGQKNVTGLSNEIDRLGKTARTPIPDPTPEMRDGADKTAAAVGALGKSLIGLVSLAAIQQFVNSSVNEFAKAEMAFRGLEAVANHSGVGIGRAMQEAEKLAVDGLITVAEASKGLQNLLSRGYTVDQAVQTLTRLKDAAAFNRSAQLSMGEAVVSASEGLKNENSILVDNAGVTKNVSVLWKEYAEQIGKSVTELTQQEKIQAEVNGILRETEAQAGNAAKALGGYQGQMAQADAEQRKFSASMGQILAPVMVGLRQAGTFIIDNVAKPIVVFFQRVGVAAAGTAVNLGLILDAIAKRDFSGLWDALSKNTEDAKKRMAELGEEMKKGALDLAPLGQAAQKTAADTGKATAQMAKDLKALAKDRKDSTKEQIADAERLRDALIKAFDDSIKAERDYRAEAKKLRAEAAAQPSDGSAEAEASATLALIAAEQQLLRIKGSAPLEDVQAQSELVQALAASLGDQARATEAVNRAKLAEADALDRAAAAEAQRQAGITEQQKDNGARLAKFQALLKDLESGKSVTVNAETDEATAAVEKFKYLIDSIKDKTITLKVDQAGAAAGAIPGYATGTVLPGYGGGDRRLILAEDGEAITRKEAVAYYGRSFMAALNARQIPRFQTGGIVDRVAAAPVAPGASALQQATLNFPGMGAWPVSAQPATLDDMRAAIAREALKRGRRV